MEYLQQVMNSKYFEHIKDSNHFEKKIQKLIQESRLVKKKPLDLVCEYGSKSNFLYFILEGKLAVFIPKNESDLEKQLSLFIEIEQYKRIVNKEPNQLDAVYQLQKLQAEWIKTQKSFDSELLNNLKQYQISLRPHNSVQDEDQTDEKKNQTIQLSSYIKKDVCRMKKVGEMNPGHCFGEVGAILDKPRTATIIAMESTVYLHISFKKYQEIFTQEQIYELNFCVLNLSQIFLDKTVSTDVIAHLATHFYSIPSANIVYKQQQFTLNVYFIQQRQ